MKLNFKTSWLLALVLGVLGLVLVGLLCPEGPSRFAAELGIAGCLGASLVGLFAKRWALRRSAKEVLAVTGAMFFVRVLLCGGGALWLRAHQGNVPAFVLAFTLMFFILVWVETAFLFSAWQTQVGGATA